MRRDFVAMAVSVLILGCSDSTDTEGGPEGGTSSTDAAVTDSRPACAGPLECYPTWQAAMCGGVVLKTASFSFDPKDPRWAEDYQTCVDQSGGLIRPTECDWFCDAIVTAHFGDQRVQGFGVASIDCSRPDQPTITVEYSDTTCDPSRP